MSRTPSALELLVVTIWIEARAWPEAARARLPELRALVQHHGLPCPAREHNVLAPCPLVLRRLLETAASRGELRGLADLSWAVDCLTVELTFALRKTPGDSLL